MPSILASFSSFTSKSSTKIEKMSYSQKIKAFREAKSMTHQQFADAVGVSRGSVQQWESGATAPKRKNQPAVSKFIGISISDLMTESPSATPPETGNYPLANSHKKTALAPVQKAQGAISFDDAVRVMAEFLMPVDASTSEMVMTVLGRLAQYPDEHERIARAAMAVLESGKRRAA
jgi:transcriptional regulator with XRE-family HTH domain